VSVWTRDPDVRLPRGMVVLMIVLGIAIVGGVVFARSLVSKAAPIPQQRVVATLRGTGLTIVPSTGSQDAGVATAYTLTRGGAPLPVTVTVFDTLVRARQAALRAVNARTFRVRNVLLVEARDISRQDEPIVLAAMNRLGRPVSP
jgi:hypothetical protein